MATCDLTLSDRSMYRGDTYKFTATIKNNGVVLDITGYTVLMSVRKTYKDLDNPVDPDIESTATIPVGTDGVANFVIIPADTADLDARDYIYDIELTSGSGEVSTIGVGKFTILKEVS